MIDTSTEFGARAERRLREEIIGWLVTVRADGSPEPIPVWFLWEGDSFLLYSQPGKRKLRNIEQHPQVALHLDSDREDADIVIVSGEARVSDDPPADQVPAYIEKYREAAARLGWSPEQFAEMYSVPLRVSFGRLSGH